MVQNDLISMHVSYIYKMRKLLVRQHVPFTTVVYSACIIPIMSHPLHNWAPERKTSACNVKDRGVMQSIYPTVIIGRLNLGPNAIVVQVEL